MGAIGHDLKLHNGHEAFAPAYGGVACRSVDCVNYRQVAGQALSQDRVAGRSSTLQKLHPSCRPLLLAAGYFPHTKLDPSIQG